MKQSSKTQDGNLPYQQSLWAGSPDHANPTPQRAKEKARKTLDISGRNLIESYARLSRSTLSGRMFLALLIGQEGWYSSKSRLTWKLNHTKYGRSFCRLVVSTLRTKGIGSGSLQDGLLMTPSTVDIGITENRIKDRTAYRESVGRHYVPGCLTEQIQGLLPTPQSRDEKNGSKATDKRIQRKVEQGWTIDLNDLATSGMLPTPTNSMATYQDFEQAKFHSSKRPEYSEIMLPTPTCQDAKQKENSPSQQHKIQELSICVAGGSGSQLSVLFVEEMMGYPLDYLVLPFQSGGMRE